MNTDKSEVTMLITNNSYIYIGLIVMDPMVNIIKLFCFTCQTAIVAIVLECCNRTRMFHYQLYYNKLSINHSYTIIKVCNVPNHFSLSFAFFDQLQLVYIDSQDITGCALCY